jgi:hypothetical protein
MMIYIKVLYAAVMILAITCASAMAEDYIKGRIDDISADKTSITVSGTKISADKNFVDDFFLIKGDEVEITVKRTDKGPEATDCTFPYENPHGGVSSGK